MKRMTYKEMKQVNAGGANCTNYDYQGCLFDYPMDGRTICCIRIKCDGQYYQKCGDINWYMTA